MTSFLAPDFARRLRVYWLAWLGVVALALLLRFTFFLLGSGHDTTDTLAETYFLLTPVALVAVSYAERGDMMTYLRVHHPRRWEWLTSTPFGGPGWHNGFRGKRWLHSAEDEGDPVVFAYKRDRRRLLRWVYTVFWSNIIIVPVLAWP